MRNEIGLRIARLREEKGLSQQQLTEELEKYGLKVRRETVTQWENGTRDLKTEYTIKLSEYFNVSADYLLGLSEIPSRNETIQSINEYTGLSQDAVAALHTEKHLNEREISDFISFLTVSEPLPNLIQAIKQKNGFSDKAICHIDIDGEDHKTDMNALFKLIITDLFFEIIAGYTAKSGETLVAYKKGGNHG